MTEITIKSPAVVIVAFLLLSALPVRAQSCSLSYGTLKCPNLKNVTVLKDFLENMGETSLLQVKIVYDIIRDSILTTAVISPTISCLPSLLDCLISSPNFNGCESLS